MLRWTVRIGLGFLAALFVVFLILFHSAIYHRFILFPKEAHAWNQLQASRIPPTLDSGWKEFKGVLHSHSKFSHDSEVPFDDILATLKQANCNFIFMSDHCVDGKADYSLQWHGLKDGVLFVPGFEMSAGFMPWGLPDNTVLDCGADLKALAKQIGSLGGLLFFAHSEEDRLWELPELTGMEIYNIHTNLLAKNMLSLVPDILFCFRAYPDETFRLVFDRQTKILAHWDQLNDIKKVVGIAANDAHQNSGLRGYYTGQNSFLLKTTGPDVVGEWKLNGLTRLMLRMFFGPLEPGKQLFRWEVDPYLRSVRFVNTHLLANELTEPALLDALRQGRVFSGFDMLVDSTGFTYLAKSGGGKAIMGESIAYAPDAVLKAASPVPCRFTVLRSGQQVYQAEGREMEWKPGQAGKYRVEAELSIVGEWTPWVYTNPIELK